MRCNDEFDARDRGDYGYEILCPHRFEDERLFAKFEHEKDELREYLMEMRTYMPPQHVAFIEAVEKGPSVRDFVRAVKNPNLISVFNECVEIVADFRAKHLEYAGTYIHAQAQATPGNPSAVGTGGTPFMVYLRKHRDETRSQILK